MPDHNKSRPASAGSDDYDGPERRAAGGEPAKPRKEIRYDAKGNPVLDLRTDEVARRRRDDDTLDLIKCLDIDTLELEDEDIIEETGTWAGFDPYARG